MPTVQELKDWLAELPPEFDGYPVEAVVHSCPFPLKRIVAYKNKDGSGSGGGVAFNAMGTHFSDEWYREVEIIARLQS